MLKGTTTLRGSIEPEAEPLDDADDPAPSSIPIPITTIGAAANDLSGHPMLLPKSIYPVASTFATQSHFWSIDTRDVAVVPMLDSKQFLPIGAARLACLVVFAVTLSAAADSKTRISPPIKAHIDALAQKQIANGATPGIALAITKDGQTIYENAAGVKHIISKAPMLITTSQAIGSITKQFTAAAILLLQQQKKLSIDDKLSKYVPEYIEADKVTLRQMLNMVSGISDNDPGIYGDHLQRPITRKEMFVNLNKLPPMWKPGTHMVYTNTNYNLLGLVVERASGQPYLRYLQENIFIPLGMTSTSTIDQPPPGMATGYSHDKPGQPFETRAELHPDFSFGTGNLVSTARDLMKWDAGLLGGRVLDQASLTAMFTVPGGGKITTVLETDKRFPAIKNISDGEPTVYAMGWMLPNPHTKWHGGHTFLFESTNALFDDGYNIAIIGNVRDGGYFEPENLAAEIHNMLNPAVHIPPLTVVVRQPSSTADTPEVQ